MAAITLNIPDAQVNRIVEAMSAISDPDGPATAAKAKAALVRYVRDTTLAYERRQAVADAVAQAQTPAELEDIT